MAKEKAEDARKSSVGLRLRAEDETDLAVFAACLQSARTRRADMTYLKGRRRFALVLERYCWEDVAPELGDSGELPSRTVRCGVHFDGVMAAASHGLDLARPEQRLELLTILPRSGAKGSAELHFLFADGAVLRLGVECIDAVLADFTDFDPADPAERG